MCLFVSYVVLLCRCSPGSLLCLFPFGALEDVSICFCVLFCCFLFVVLCVCGMCECVRFFFFFFFFFFYRCLFRRLFCCAVGLCRCVVLASFLYVGKCGNVFVAFLLSCCLLLFAVCCFVCVLFFVRLLNV